MLFSVRFQEKSVVSSPNGGIGTLSLLIVTLVMVGTVPLCSVAMTFWMSPSWSCYLPIHHRCLLHLIPRSFDIILVVSFKCFLQALEHEHHLITFFRIKTVSIWGNTSVIYLACATQLYAK
eukprot:Gb_37533 [translate_table: standard]